MRPNRGNPRSPAVMDYVHLLLKLDFMQRIARGEHAVAEA